jgi:hypothetical protein
MIEIENDELNENFKAEKKAHLAQMEILAGATGAYSPGEIAKMLADCEAGFGHGYSAMMRFMRTKGVVFKPIPTHGEVKIDGPKPQ